METQEEWNCWIIRWNCLGKTKEVAHLLKPEKSFIFV